MLLRFSIQNYALIEQLELHPSANLNVITGETGAGKSIILGALGLLLGNRADTSALLNEDKKCVVEAEFDIQGYGLEPVFEEVELDFDENTIIRREISPKGKSRAFVNDTPLNLTALKQIVSRLMDVHSQHDTLKLGSNAFQLQVIDALAENDQIRETYRHSYHHYCKLRNTYNELVEWQHDYRKEMEYDRHLLNELEEAAFEKEEQEQLEEEQKLLENAADIKLKLQTALQYLSQNENSVSACLKTVHNNIAGLSALSETFSELAQRIDSAHIELKDIEHELQKEEEKTELDPGRLEWVNERLSAIYRLQQKHQVDSIEDILNIQEKLKTKLNKAENLDDEIKAKEQELNESIEQLNKDAGQLSQSRQSVFATTEQKITDLLAELGIPNASFKVQHKKTDFGPSGNDEITFLFTANKGITPQELKNVASGGEFSRLMLALKYIIADKVALPTIIFDEIDTGISGSIAIKVGHIMKNMAQNHQLIAITHLPQIAAKGDQHYNVYKDESRERTESKIEELTHDNRLKNIARMIGGDEPSEAAYENARELIERKN